MFNVILRQILFEFFFNDMSTFAGHPRDRDKSLNRGEEREIEEGKGKRDWVSKNREY